MKKNVFHCLTIMMLVLGVSAQASAECKGQSKSACSSSDQCNWIKSYKTKSGSTVKAYCRAAPGKSTKKSSNKKTTSKKETKKSTTSKTVDKTSKKASASKKTTSKKSTSKKTDKKKSTSSSSKQKKSTKPKKTKDSKKSS